MGLYDFNANDPGSYDQMELRKRIALQLMSGTKKGYPKNIGEGLASIGDSLGEGMAMRAMLQSQAALDKNRTDKMNRDGPAAPGGGVSAAAPAAAAVAAVPGPQASVTPSPVTPVSSTRSLSYADPGPDEAVPNDPVVADTSRVPVDEIPGVIRTNPDGTIAGNVTAPTIPAPMPPGAPAAGAGGRRSDAGGVGGFPQTASLDPSSGVMPMGSDTSRRDPIARLLLNGTAPEVPQQNPTSSAVAPPNPLTAAAAGSPPEAAGNRAIVMSDVKPQPVEPVPVPGAQTAQYKPPEIVPRRPASAQPPDPVVVPPTSAPLPNQPPGVYDDDPPPRRPDPVPVSPAQANYAQQALRERDPAMEKFYSGQAALLEAERARKDALQTKEYESRLSQHNARTLARDEAQRALPITQQQLIEQKYKVQQQAEQDQQRALFGNLPPHVHEYLSEGRKNAQSAVGSLEGLRNAKEAMDAGTLFGIAAPVKLAYYQARAEAGDQNAARIVAATQTFKTALGPTAQQAIHSYGGSQISNDDRKFGMAMSGADYTQDEKSARRMIDIAERSAKLALQEHRENLDIMLKDIPPRVRRMYDVPDPMPGIPMAGAKPGGIVDVPDEAAAKQLQPNTKFRLPSGRTGTVR